jgi:hypothetical protein
VTAAYWANPDDEDAWDRVELGGEVLPGVWRVDFQAVRNVDVKKSKGSDGGHIRDHGYDPSPITLTGKFIDFADWFTYQKLLPSIHPKTAGGTRAPLSISHPALELMGVKTVYVREITAPQIDDGGICTVVIGCLEYQKPEPAEQSKTVTKKAGATPNQTDPKDIAASKGEPRPEP